MPKALFVATILLVWSENTLVAGTRNTTEIWMCSQNGVGERTFFMDPNMSSDYWSTSIGLSWTLLVSAVEEIAGQEYLVGQLVSPRGSKQPHVGYVLSDEWDCVNAIVSSNG